MAKRTKVMGWKDNEVVISHNGGTTEIFDDIKQGSSSLDREEGETTEALIESGEAEGVYKAPDRYILSFERRVDTTETVKAGFTDSNDTVEVRPKRAGARSVKLTGCSCDVSVKYDSTDGVVAHYEFKTKGAVDSDGNLTDIEVGKVIVPVEGPSQD